MCKNTLGYPDNQDCGCGCPSCETAKKHSTRIQSTARERSEYSKLVSDDSRQSQSAVMQFANSGYSKKSGTDKASTTRPSEYSSKEALPVEPTPEKFVLPGCAASSASDNEGFLILGVGLLLLLGVAFQIKNQKA